MRQRGIPAQLGKEAEDNACAYLVGKGLRLLERNYRSPGGEIDLVMQEHDIIVFVEVRFRSNRMLTGALESISREKCRRIARCGAHYLQSHKLDNRVNCRFDLLLIEKDEATHTMEWLPNAFDASP